MISKKFTSSIKLFSTIIITLLLSSLESRSQWAIMEGKGDSLLRQGADYIYNVQFDEASKCFNEVIKSFPDHPAGYFLDAMVEYWKITLYRRTERFDKLFLEKIQRVINLCDKQLEKNSYDIKYLFFKGGAYGYRGRFYATRRSWLNAISDGKSGFDILMKCQQIAPGNHDIMLGTGSYNYFAAALPEEYPFLKPLMIFLPKGDKVIGRLQLHASAKYARYAGTEAEVVLLQIYYNFEKNADLSVQTTEKLFSRYPNNPYFHRYLGRSYVLAGEIEKSEATWREIVKRCISKQTGYDFLTMREACYYVGNALLRRNENDAALKYFLKSVEGSEYLEADDDEESGFYVLATLKIARIYRDKNNKKLAKEYYQKLLKMRDYGGSHTAAKNYLNIK